MRRLVLFGLIVLVALTPAHPCGWHGPGKVTQLARLHPSFFNLRPRSICYLKGQC